MDMDKLFRAMAEDDYVDWCKILQENLVTKKLISFLASIENISGFNLSQARHLIKNGSGNDAIELVTSHIFPNFQTIDFIAESFAHGLTKEQIKVFALPEFSICQMRVIRKGLELGLSIEQAKTFADPKISFEKMKIMCDNLLIDNRATHLKELFKNVPAN